MSLSNNTIALIYDFDGTLSPLNMQEYGLLQDLAGNIGQFWADNRAMAVENDADDVLCYLYRLLLAAKHSGISLSRDILQRYGQRIELYEGVSEWFQRIKDYGRTLNLNIQHYIISSGLREMIEGTTIAHCFDGIYACSYLYNERDEACWPAVAVDYTAKTQFLFKINKGIREVSDNTRVNSYLPLDERPVPMPHMIYFGDGETDIPCMRMVKQGGGHSIAIYGTEKKKKTAQHLMNDGRVNFACYADYSEGSEIDLTVKRILQDISYE